MTRPFDKHLDNDELDRLVLLQETSVSGSEQLSEPALREAQRHVESCQDCSRKLQTHKFVQSEILRMRVPKPSTPTPECVGDAEWLEVAAGLLSEAKTRELMKHAAQCGHCGPLLKSAAEALVGEATPSEEALLASLQSARPEWRKNMAETLRDSVRDRQPKASRWRAVFAWPAPAYAFAGIVAVALVAWIGVRALHPPSAEQLLAQAYTEHRTLEVRITGAKYAPMQAERGTGQSDFDKPHSLLKAKDMIGEALGKNPNDPKWLQARGRAELLDGNYESAIKSLQRALETQPDSPSLLTDLGSAYYQRARSADRPIDYGNAIESFGKALARDPDNPIALFNRALTCEQMFFYTQAIDDWQRYLRLDPNGDWSAEAKQHLQAIQQKLNQHSRKVAEPLLAPAQIVQATDPTLSDQLDQHIEAYLNVAVQNWLPTAFPLAPDLSHASVDARTSLALLTDIALQRHGDRWLSDLMSSSSSAIFPAAIDNLAAALRFNASGDNVRARSHAVEAVRLFAAQNNAAGELRSRLESMVAERDAQDASGCTKTASGVESRLQRHPYRWLQTQFLIESGDCSWISGDLGDVEKFFLRAAQQAQISGYGVLYLRTQDHLSLIAETVGDLPGAWLRTQQALPHFWLGAYPPMRGYNLYYDRYELAFSSRQPFLQMVALRDAVNLSESLDDNLVRAFAHELLANSALEAGQFEFAKAEYARASQLFSESPQIESTQIALLEVDVRMAGVELRQGKTQQAIYRLRLQAPGIEQHDTKYLTILHYSTLGEAETQAGNTREATAALERAVAAADQRLKSLHDDKSRIEWVEQSATAYRDLVQQLLLQGDSEGALELWEAFRGAELHAVDSAAISLDQLHQVSTQRPNLTAETVITYADLPKGFAVWVFDNRGLWSGWIPGDPKQTRARVDRFHALCSDPASDPSDLSQNARTLYDTFFAPVESQITPGRLLVIDADDGLAGLPFEALVDAQGRYLADRFSITASRGIYYRSDNRAQISVTSGSTALIIAVPTSSADAMQTLTPLPDALAEADAVASGFSNTSVLRASQVTADAIAANLPSAQVFHFAGHAVLSARHSGLLLADSFLSAADLRKMSLRNLRLAVLSACQTQDGSGGDGLVRVFLAAGVPDVVASRWSVNSAATREFMDFFYRNLLAGHSVADSIRQAQISLRSRRGMSHPFYWAAFTSFGSV